MEDWRICWRLRNKINIYEAVSLILDIDPMLETHTKNNYKSVLALLEEAINFSELPYEYDGHNGYSIMTQDLRIWLTQKNLKSNFFSEPELSYNDCLNPNHPRYAHKLAAALKAWLATGDIESTGMKAKEALEKWLKDHASQYNLLHEDGTLINEAIEQCAAVANWDPRSGARKTQRGNI